MADYPLDISLTILGKEYTRAKNEGKDSFSVHVSFFDGFDTDHHLQAFAQQYPVRISRSIPDRITFLID